MRWTSILAIYLLFWAFSVFLVIPFGVKTGEEAGAEHVPGQAESAPHGFDIWKMIRRTTILSLVLFAIYYIIYVNGWVSAQDLDIFSPLEP